MRFEMNASSFSGPLQLYTYRLPKLNEFPLLFKDIVICDYLIRLFKNNLIDNALTKSKFRQCKQV
uniref:Uncharacterized protein n=1 Tax=Sinocyclocheilus anshuiensis TaxID=1608454 RepID=A0A671K5F7_9TELE